MDSFVVIDTEEGDFEFHSTFKEAMEYAGELLGAYREAAGSDGWPEFEGFVQVFRLVAQAEFTDVRDREDCNVDEEGVCRDCSAYFPDQCDRICDAKIVPVR